jgi:nitrite reductase (NADH) small subunit
MNQSERAAVQIAGTPVYVKDAGVAQMMDAGADGWHQVCALDAIPQLGARVVKTEHGAIAIFRTADDEVFALADKCPHKGGPLSQGIVFGRKVACPLHGWNIGLDDGNAVAPDKGCTRSYLVKVQSGLVYLNLGAPPPTAANAQ